MVPQTNLDQAQLALASLLFQSNVPQGEQSRRAFFITSAVQRLYRSFDYDMAEQTVEIATDSDGLGDLSDLALGPTPAIQFVNDGVRNYDFIFARNATGAAQGDFKYWVIVNEDGQWELHSTEPDTTLTITYWQAPDISSSQAVTFTPMVIGKGALIYYRQAQDPEADTSVEEDQFKQEVSEIIEKQNRTRPQRQAENPRDRAGVYPGRT